MWGDSHGTWGRCHITLSVPLEGDPVKVRVSCTEMGCYVEVRVATSHFFAGGLIFLLWKILKYIVYWLIYFSFHRSVFIFFS
jgi:hypothetical protein